MIANLDVGGAELVRLLGGAWDWKGGRGMCLCPAHADRSPSLSVRVGKRALLFHCFAGCTNRAVIHALAALRPDALRNGTSLIPPSADPGGAPILRRVASLWDAGTSIVGSPAQLYLAHRAIEAPSDALRYHPRTPLGPKAIVQFRPAMLAAVQERGEIVALQRTFLDIRSGRRARDLENCRRMLGRPGGGCVRLAPASDVLGLAEGVESGLSAMILLGVPVWSTLGSERLARVDVPLSVRRLVLLADRDKAGWLGATAALQAHAVQGRDIEIVWPWYGLNDWNDVLRRLAMQPRDRPQIP